MFHYLLYSLCHQYLEKCLIHSRCSINIEGSQFIMGFPGGSDSKESACNAEDPGLISGSERFPGGGNGSPLQYSCLENSMDRGAWQATVHGVENDYATNAHTSLGGEGPLEESRATQSSILLH